MNIMIVFPADKNNIGSDSDNDLQDEDIAEGSPSRTEHRPISTLSPKSKEILWNKSALSKSNSNQATTSERTVFRMSDDTYPMEIDPSKKQMRRIQDGVLPMRLQMQSSPSPSVGHLQTLDFSSAHSQTFLKLGAPLLFHPGQLSVKPEAFSATGVGHLFSSSPGENDIENGVLSSQSITPPFMCHLAQHMLPSQVRFSRSTVF